MSDIEDRLRRLFVDHLGVDAAEVVPDATIEEELGADSIDKVELIMAVEEEFDIEIGDDEASKITTFGEALDAVHAKVGSPA